MPRIENTVSIGNLLSIGGTNWVVLNVTRETVV